jgi:hypothetical protein
MSRVSPERNIVAQRFDLQIGIDQALLDDVANADQARQLAVLHHGQVAGAPLGHHFHDLGDGVMGRATQDIAGHLSVNPLGQGIRTMPAEAVDDVTFREDALDIASAVQYQNRTDTILDQQADSLGDRSVRRDGHDMGSLALDDGGDMHEQLSPFPGRSTMGSDPWRDPSGPPFLPAA